VADQVHLAEDDLLEAPCELANLWRAQTPQIFRYGLLYEALKQAELKSERIRDEATAMLQAGHKPRIIMGSEQNLKITYRADLDSCIRAMQGSVQISMGEHFVGQGMDVHAFGPGDHLMLGGIRIPCDNGIKAHSDGDVLLHALCDAILGACGLGDIGEHFPDTSDKWRNADSADFLRECMRLAGTMQLAVRNADLNVIAAKPKIKPYRDARRKRIAELIGVNERRVNVKATTTEGLGFTGRAEGIFASAVVSLVSSSDI
jgi:2-C-methyl-D-erythritol 2,4-cyclodiphosphate synthase